MAGNRVRLSRQALVETGATAGTVLNDKIPAGEIGFDKMNLDSADLTTDGALKTSVVNSTNIAAGAVGTGVVQNVHMADAAIKNAEVATDAAIVESKILFASDGHDHSGGTSGAPIGGINFLYNQVASPAADGTVTKFTFATNPNSYMELYLMGILQRPGGEDYTHTSGEKIVTFAEAPETGDNIMAQYNA
jgi:hypothetical protein